MELFASSGGAVNALSLVAAHPDDVHAGRARAAVDRMLPDTDAAGRSSEAVQPAYEAKGWGHGMAAFMAMTSWQGEFTDATSRGRRPTQRSSACPSTMTALARDVLLTAASCGDRDYQPDFAALEAASTRIVIAVGVESRRDLDRPHVRRDRRLPRAASDRVSQPPRRLSGRRGRLGRAAGGVRSEAARGPRLIRDLSVGVDALARAADSGLSMGKREEPSFVATIAGASTSSSTPPSVASTGESPTVEQPITVPEAWSAAPQRPRKRRKPHRRMMSRVLLSRSWPGSRSTPRARADS